MRIYHGATSPDALRKCREHAPSHTHGFGWGPAKMTPHDVPYFVDNGAYTGDFDKEAWLTTLEKAWNDMPRRPDFVVYPDVFGDAEATRERVRDIFRYWSRDELQLLAKFDRYIAIQPGLPIGSQVRFANNVGASGVFVGGTKAWSRAYGADIAREATKNDLRSHVGNPSEADGLEWAYRSGFDSADTTSVVHNDNWHWLGRLESVTEETGASDVNSSQSTLPQATAATDGGSR